MGLPRTVERIIGKTHLQQRLALGGDQLLDEAGVVCACLAAQILGVGVAQAAVLRQRACQATQCGCSDVYCHGGRYIGFRITVR